MRAPLCAIGCSWGVALSWWDMVMRAGNVALPHVGANSFLAPICSRKSRMHLWAAIPGFLNIGIIKSRLTRDQWDHASGDKVLLQVAVTYLHF